MPAKLTRKRRGSNQAPSGRAEEMEEEERSVLEERPILGVCNNQSSSFRSTILFVSNRWIEMRDQEVSCEVYAPLSMAP